MATECRQRMNIYAERLVRSGRARRPPPRAAQTAHTQAAVAGALDVHGGADECEVSERLREVAEQVARCACPPPPRRGRAVKRRRAGFSNHRCASSKRPTCASASASQKEHSRNAPSSPSRPSSQAAEVVAMDQHAVAEVPSPPRWC